MLHNILSLIIGGAIIVGIIVGVVYFIEAVDKLEKRVKNTKPYKIASSILAALIFIMIAIFLAISCWSLGDSILTSISC